MQTKDFADFLAALNSEGASYVVIGGIAVLSHVPYRTTRDLDILIEPTLENARRTREAVRSWGGFDPEFSPQGETRHRAVQAVQRQRRVPALAD